MNKERRKEIPVGTRPGQTGLWKSELHALLRLYPVCMPTFEQWGIDQQEEEDLCWEEDDQCWSSPKTTAAEIKGKCLRYMFITAESKEKEGSNEVRNDHQEGLEASDDRFAAHRLPTREREKELLVARRLPTTSAPEPQGQPCPQASSSDSGGENSTLPPPKRPR